ncbi:MAG: apolipoprotein N-acyltransferase [Geminicoccaceae bacterium]
MTSGLSLAGRLPWWLALIAGAISALSLAPVHFLPALLCFGVLMIGLIDAGSWRRGLWLGWLFGLGHMLAGLYWIAVAFYADAERFGALAFPAVFALSAFLALFIAVPSALLAARPWRSPVAAALAFTCLWMASELIRYWFTPFPWNLIGYAWVGAPAFSQMAALGGVWLAGVAALIAGTLPVAAVRQAGGTGLGAVGLTVVMLLATWGFGAHRLGQVLPSDHAEIRLRLVQGNVEQSLKWDAELSERWFNRHLDMSETDVDQITHIIWPESASPYLLARDDIARQAVAAAAPPGGIMLVGGNRLFDDQRPAYATNSLFVIDGEAQILHRYDKVDLVPFGEFMPFRELFGRLGLSALAAGSLDFRPGPGRQIVRAPGLPPFSPLICYEVIFPGRATPAGERPDWLLNVTNDAWFGPTSGPYQHLAMARMRAVELGLPLIRAANTGISAVIDAHGQIRSALALGRQGVIDTSLPGALSAPTPFARFGYLAVALALVVAAFLAILCERRTQTRHLVHSSLNKRTIAAHNR